MAADLYVLIRNDFHLINDLAQAKMYAEHTMRSIEKQLGKGSVSNLICDYDEDMIYVEFEIGEDSEDWVSVTLQNGYWMLYTAIHYKHLVNDYKGRFMLCESAHRYARLLCESEVWYTHDMLLDQYDINISLDDIIAEEKKRGNYAEFEPAELLKLPYAKRPQYGLYHDKFE